MAKLQPIRIGNTFQRTYRRKNPDGSPMNLTGLVHTFNLKAGQTRHTFNGSTGVTVTPLEGKIEITLTTEQTTAFKPDRAAKSYLEITDGSGNVVTRAHRPEKVIRPEEL